MSICALLVIQRDSHNELERLATQRASKLLSNLVAYVKPRSKSRVDVEVVVLSELMKSRLVTIAEFCHHSWIFSLVPCAKNVVVCPRISCKIRENTRKSGKGPGTTKMLIHHHHRLMTCHVHVLLPRLLSQFKNRAVDAISCIYGW